MRPSRLVLAGALLALGPSATAAVRGRPLSFERDVAPVLERWCVGCHGPTEQRGGLRLDEFVWVMRGGDTAPAVAPGDPAGSLLVTKIERRSRPAMPPRRTLPAPLVARLRAWIAGAPP
ncbi:MAG TPA: c-type cytochrome domain-containing protein [Polyangia bacterium]|nr:c-type cytochrome domain-containing protein [Polyangia bacterium]